jgi:DNA-binding SARP family transcriptional activator
MAGSGSNALAPAPRPGLRLDAPVTVVVAAAGYGKTTRVRGWLAGRACRWYAANELGGRTWTELAAGASVVVVDDIRSDTDSLATLVADLPAGRRLLLIGRVPMPAVLRSARSLCRSVGPDELALDEAGTAGLLRERLGEVEPELAAEIWRLTAGWPALVNLAAEAVGARSLPPDDLPVALAAPGSPTHEYLAGQVLDGLTETARRLLCDMAYIGPCSAGLAAALGHGDGRDLGTLAALGLLDPPLGGREWYQLIPLLAAVIRARWPRPCAELHRVAATATAWYLRAGRHADAVRARCGSHEAPQRAELVREHGDRLMANGYAGLLVEVIRGLPAELVDDAMRLLLAESLHTIGETDAALTLFAALAAEGTDRDGSLPAALAWRYGMALYLRGSARPALELLRRGRHDPAPSADGALLHAWTATACWITGEAAACGEQARLGLAVATATGDERALATAHVALALHAQLLGDRVGLAAQYTQALALAESCGDPGLVTRIRTNRASSLIQEARYPAALEMIQPAVALAERTGNRAMHALALTNEAEALCRLGRLDEATSGFERAITLYQRMRSRKVAYPLTGLGEVYRRRGRPGQARGAFEEALRAADGDDSVQRTPTLAALARLLAEQDPPTAREYAALALSSGVGPGRTAAVLALGRAALTDISNGATTGSALAAVRGQAQAAADSARLHRDPAGLAEALELEAAALADDPPAARRLLTEALAIWTDAQAAADRDRVQVLLGRLPGADHDDRIYAKVAARRAVTAGSLDPHPPGSATSLEVRVLGNFALLRDGEPVPGTAWQSRKARDLVKILVARRGRPVPREELADLLWGTDRPDRVAHRLAVLLHAARTVLDPDRRHAPDRFIAANGGSVALDLRHVAVDAEWFLSCARLGLRLHASGEPSAGDVLVAAELAYAGDAFENEPYEDWGTSLREEARAAFLHAVRALAELSETRGQADETVRYLLTALRTDPYDERSHLDLIRTLVAAGRHGEASRARARHLRAMVQIGVPASPSR